MADRLVRVQLVEAELASGKEFDYTKNLYEHLSYSPVPDKSVIIENWGTGGGVPGALFALSEDAIRLAMPVVSAIAAPAIGYATKKVFDLAIEAVYGAKCSAADSSRALGYQDASSKSHGHFSAEKSFQSLFRFSPATVTWE